MSSDTSGSGSTGGNTGETMPPAEMGGAATQAPATETATQAAPQPEGRRTQLRLVRENIQTLSQDIGNSRRSHEQGFKRLEKQVAALRSELAAASLSKDVGALRKSHDAGSKKLEKQVASLRIELAELKGHIAKDAARSRAKQEATLSKILAKVSAKPKTSKSSKK